MSFLNLLDHTHTLILCPYLKIILFLDESERAPDFKKAFSRNIFLLFFTILQIERLLTLTRMFSSAERKSGPFY